MRYMPINPDTIKELFYDKYESGCEVIETDIAAALMEKSEKWSTREICALQSIINAHQATPMVIGVNEDAMATLKLDEFHVSIKQIEYDMAVHKVYSTFQAVTLHVYDANCIPSKRRKQPPVSIITPHPQQSEPRSPKSTLRGPQCQRGVGLVLSLGSGCPLEGTCASIMFRAF